MENTVRRLGWDPGFGGNKIAEVVDGQISTNIMPSVVGVGDTNAGALNQALRQAHVRGGRRTRPYRVGFAGVEYLVGPGVSAYARPIERMDFQRFTESPELRALLYATLWQALDGGSHRVALAIALPVEVLMDAQRAAATERDMAAWLVGAHTFTLDAIETQIEIVNIRAKIAQPLATWFDWGLDNSGAFCRGAEAAKAPCLVVDEGFNTLDLIAVEGGRISTRYTGGDTLGMRRAAEMTATNIQRRYGVELSLHEADELVQAVIGGKSASTYVLGAETDVTAEVQQAIAALSAEVRRFVERQVGNGKRFRILLTGGGAVALAGSLIQMWPHAEVMPDPVLANARGLAKLAQRQGFL